MARGESILLASGKGGTGKTTVAANLGATLALRGARVILVDLNMGLRNLDIYLGMENEILFDVGDVISGVCSIRKALVNDERIPGLSLLPAAQGKVVAGITPAHIKALLDKLKEHFDVVLIDGPTAAWDHLALLTAGADRAIVLLSPDYSSLRNGDMVDRRLQEAGVQSRCYIVNQLRPELFGRQIVPDLGEITDTFRTSMAGIIQYDDNIHIANNRGVPVVLQRESYIARNFDLISKRLFG